MTLLLVFVALRGIAQAFLNPSWIGWMRDIVPQDVMGSFFSQRMRIATIAAAVAGLVGAFYIDWWAGRVPEPEKIYGYSYAMLFGSILLGFGAVGFMARMPEPRMVAPEGQRPTILQMLAAPLRDANYRQLMSFLMVWSLASQLAVPFFSVYMLTKLEMPLSAVVGLAVLSQATSVLFVNVWGGYVDRFGSKVVLSISSSLYLLVILGWTFTTTPDPHALTVPLLIVLHFLIGIASAGINLASTTIRMKMAPQAQSTSYLTGASLAASLGAGIGPILGGIFVDFFSVRRFEISIEWVDPARTVEFPAVFLTGYDFLFALAFLFGLVTLSVLGRVREEGESNREAVMSELAAQTRENLRVLNSVPGMNLVGSLPLGRRRYVPAVAGLDVAAGVTAYQLAASIQSVATTAARSGATARQVQSRVNQTVARAAQESDNLPAARRRAGVWSRARRRPGSRGVRNQRPAPGAGIDFRAPGRDGRGRRRSPHDSARCDSRRHPQRQRRRPVDGCRHHRRHRSDARRRPPTGPLRAGCRRLCRRGCRGGVERAVGGRKNPRQELGAGCHARDRPRRVAARTAACDAWARRRHGQR